MISVSLIYADAEAVIHYHSDPNVSRYQGWESQTKQEIARRIDQMKEADFLFPGSWFQFGITLTESSELIGDFAIQSKATKPRLIELGITIAPNFQRRGIASEALRAILCSVFQNPQTQSITVSIDPRPPVPDFLENWDFGRKLICSRASGSKVNGWMM